MKEILYCSNCKTVLTPSEIKWGEFPGLELENDQMLYEKIREKFTRARPDDMNNWNVAVYSCKCKKIIAIRE
jgi:hypothetical protein